MPKGNLDFLRKISFSFNSLIILFLLLFLTVITYKIILSYWGAPETITIKIGAGPKGMTFYENAESIKNILESDTVFDFDVILKETEGSEENLDSLRKNLFDFTLIHENVDIRHSVNKNKIKSLRSIQNSKLHIVTSDTSGIDLNSLDSTYTLAIGRKGSGTHRSAAKILDLYGINIDSLKENNPKIDDTTSFIKTGIFLGKDSKRVAFYLGGELIRTIAENNRDSQLRLLKLSKIEALTRLYNRLYRDTIIKEIYGKFPMENVPTIGVKTILVISKEFDKNNNNSEEIIKRILLLLEQNNFILADNKYTDFNSNKNFQKNTYPFPLHKAAESYFNKSESWKDYLQSIFTQNIFSSVGFIGTFAFFLAFKLSYNLYERKIIHKVLFLQSNLNLENAERTRDTLRKYNNDLIKFAVKKWLSLATTEAARKLIIDAIRRCTAIIEQSKKQNNDNNEDEDN